MHLGQARNLPQVGCRPSVQIAEGTVRLKVGSRAWRQQLVTHPCDCHLYFFCSNVSSTEVLGIDGIQWPLGVGPPKCFMPAHTPPLLSTFANTHPSGVVLRAWRAKLGSESPEKELAQLCSSPGKHQVQIPLGRRWHWAVGWHGVCYQSTIEADPDTVI
jgi:hypothetical protein